MPYLPGKIPFRGWITDCPYSAVPDGYTADILNVMPADPFRRRVRLGTRPASSRVYQFTSGQNVQCMLRTIAYNNATTPALRKDRIIIVAGGKFYYLDPASIAPVQITHVPAGNPNTAAVLSSTATRIEGVQRGRYAYFTDGSGSNGYVKVDLASSTLEISYWHHGSTGPEDHVTATVGGTTYTATLISSFGGRIVLAGVKTLENIWFFSNTVDPEDWNPDVNDLDDAQAGTTSTLGPVGDEIVAISPLGTSGFLFAGKRSLAYMTADPAYDATARIATLSKTVGVVGPRAICEGPEKSLYLLGQDGLYRVRPNDFDVDRGALVSLNKLDSFFSGIRYEKINPVLHYDVERRGVWIFLTRTDSPSNSTHLFYSEQVDGFFPIRLYDPAFYGAETVCQSSTADGRNQIMLCAYKNTISFFDQRLSSGCDGFPGSGYNSSLKPASGDRPAQLVVNRLSIGPIQPEQPMLVLAKELQVELCADDYLIPSDLKTGGVSIAERPKAVLIGAETPQEAIGENLNSLTVEEVLTVEYDSGEESSGTSSWATTLDGDDSTTPSWSAYGDGGYAKSPVGIYTAQDALQSPLNRQYYTDDGIYLIQRQAFLSINAGSFVVGNWYKITTVGTTTSWTAIGAVSGTVGEEFQATGVGSGNGVASEICWVIKFANNSSVNQTTDAEVVVYKQTGSPISDEVENGAYQYTVYVSGTPTLQSDQTASISTSNFADAESNDMGYLREGINNRMRCRLRYGAMYVRIGSTGWPWALERVAIDAEPISRRRTVIDVGATQEFDIK